MDVQCNVFSPEQWEFFATLETFNAPVSAEILETLVPLPPREILDLVYRATSSGLLTREEHGFALAEPLPPALHSRLTAAHSPERHARVYDTLARGGLLEQLESTVRLRLLDGAGRLQDAANLALQLAESARENGDREAALTYLLGVLDRMIPAAGDKHADRLIVAAISPLVVLTLEQGRNLDHIPALLEQAMAACHRLRDRDTLVRLSITASRLFQFHDPLDTALDTITGTLQQVESLGGETMRAHSAELLGYHYYIRGLYREAASQFELLHSRETLPQHQAFHATYLAHSAAFLGQFHRAVGIQDSTWHRARMDGATHIAPFFRADLGIILLAMRKTDEAHNHLQHALHEAEQVHNAWAALRADLGLAYHDHLAGLIPQSYDHALRAVRTARDNGFFPALRHFCWPWLLELLFSYDHAHLAPLPGLTPAAELTRVLNGVNVHHKGVALRIQARELLMQGDDEGRAAPLLEQSAAQLQHAGDPVQLATTRTEMARLQLRGNDAAKARSLALLAWEGLSAYGEDFFPRDLRALCAPPDQDTPTSQEQIIAEFLDTLSTFLPNLDEQHLFLALIRATCKFFQAERGGIFWISPGRSSLKPVLRAGVNLTAAEVNDASFRQNLHHITRSWRNNQPLTVHGAPRDRSPRESLVITCVPFELGGQPQGVLFHENTYVDERLPHLDRGILRRISRYVSAYIADIEHFSHHERRRDTSPADESRLAGDSIVSESPAMLELLTRADQAAAADAAVLILGETGVGKELLARRIHRQSRRHAGPLVVLDPGCIPENLVESELFGHEKGAFTGADRLKRGRLELAHRGTLFIDEVADIPPAAQVKLLRALQEKTFTRLGGSATLESDFRLLAATNKDLEHEVNAGRFREDLYYRLNVVPLTLPPLKRRGRDIPLLARHFLAHYAQRYSRHGLALSPDDEERLMNYPWPGNIRELKNVMERAVIMSAEGRLELNLSTSTAQSSADPFADTPTLEEVQRRYITHILEKTGQRLSGPGGATDILGLKRSTLYSRMKRLGMLES